MSDAGIWFWLYHCEDHVPEKLKPFAALLLTLTPETHDGR